MHAPAERLRPQLGRWAEITEVDAQTCELRMTTDALAWPAMALGMTGAEFEVREPPELVELLRDWADRFARAAQEGHVSRDSVQRRCGDVVQAGPTVVGRRCRAGSGGSPRRP